MRSILVLCVAFVTLVTYLETMGRQSDIGETRSSLVSRVIRTPSTPKIEVKQTETASTVNKSMVASATAPLNLKLKLTTFNKLRLHYNDSKTSLKNLFKPVDKTEISYNAELVYDAEKGENITGGKVNIKIPFG